MVAFVSLMRQRIFMAYSIRNLSATTLPFVE
jgi:hypothetical protein